jgi:FkbM family methyltransferase
MILFVFFVIIFTVTNTNAAHHRQPNHCLYSGRVERTLSALTLSLFHDGWLPPGDVLDVGAATGEWACMYACFDSQRKIFAVDPDIRNMNRCKAPNVKYENYGIGNTTSSFFYPDSVQNNGLSLELDTFKKNKDDTNSNNKIPGKTVTIETIDNLFKIFQTRPSFLHIDVEGYELYALQGGNSVINKYHPIFTIECHVIENKDYTISLIKEATEVLNYSCYMVNEVCGSRHDCRNYICFPPTTSSSTSSSSSSSSSSASISEPDKLNDIGSGSGYPSSHSHTQYLEEDVKNYNNHFIQPALDIAIRHGGISSKKITCKNVFDIYEKMKATALPWYEWDKFFMKPSVHHHGKTI